MMCMGTKVKSIIVLVLISILVFSSMSLAVNESGCYTTGGYRYCANAYDTTRRSQPIYETQALHTKGYSTTISASISYTKTQSASSSISVGGSAFLTVASNIGVGQSESYTVTAGVSYTIPSSTSTGYYRITTRFPGSNVTFTKWTLEPAIVDQYTVSYAPDKNASYRQLENYK